MPADAASLPDLIVLRNMDDNDIGPMRVRLELARERLRCIDVEHSDNWSWVDHDGRGCGLARVRQGTSLSIYETYDVRGSVFTDQTMAFPIVDDPCVAAGVAVAGDLLDRFDACLDLPRARIQQLDLPAVRLADPSARWLALASDYTGALCLMVTRAAALYAAYGRPEVRPGCVGVVPPSPDHPGDIVDGGAHGKVLTPSGAAAVATEVPRILFLTCSEQHGYVIGPPEVWYYDQLHAPDALETMRTLGQQAFQGASAGFLARRFRRRGDAPSGINDLSG